MLTACVLTTYHLYDGGNATLINRETFLLSISSDSPGFGCCSVWNEEEEEERGISVKRTNQRLRLERVTRGRLCADNRYQLTTTWCCGIPNLATHTQLRACTTRSYVSDRHSGSMRGISHSLLSFASFSRVSRDHVRSTGK